MNPGHTVDSCNDLCLATTGCKRFSFGRKDNYKNRCDLINIDDCELLTDTWDFDYFQPT